MANASIAGALRRRVDVIYAFSTIASSLRIRLVDLAINLKAAKARGITIPQSNLLRADKAIP